MSTAQSITNLQQGIATLTFSFQQFVMAQQHSIDTSIDQLNTDLQTQNNTVQMWVFSDMTQFCARHNAWTYPNRLDVQMASLSDSIGATILQSANMFQIFPLFGPFALVSH